MKRRTTSSARHEDLDALLNYIWDYLEAAVAGPDNAMTTPAFATAGPVVHTVALRRCDRAGRALSFHTDIRSRKIERLRADPRVAWMAWDEARTQQLQLFGQASLHGGDPVADALWASEPAEELLFYYKPLAPGSATDAPHPGIDTDAVREAVARSRFVVVRTVIDEIIWVHHHPDGDYRARYCWDGATFVGQWQIP